jgi:lysozyme
MIISDKGIAFICQFEGFKSKPYLDSASVPTIGYGSTYYSDGTKVTMADSEITITQALVIAKHHIDSRVMPQMVALELPMLEQYQIDAITSLAYNIGMGGFRSSSVLASIKANPADFNTITANFQKWSKAGGQTLSGLLRRRNAEAKLYCTGQYS